MRIQIINKVKMSQSNFKLENVFRKLSKCTESISYIRNSKTPILPDDTENHLNFIVDNKKSYMFRISVDWSNEKFDLMNIDECWIFMVLLSNQLIELFKDINIDLIMTSFTTCFGSSLVSVEGNRENINYGMPMINILLVSSFNRWALIKMLRKWIRKKYFDFIKYEEIFIGYSTYEKLKIIIYEHQHPYLLKMIPNKIVSRWYSKNEFFIDFFNELFNVKVYSSTKKLINCRNIVF